MRRPALVLSSEFGYWQQRMDKIKKRKEVIEGR